MQHLERSGTSVLYIGRTALKVKQLVWATVTVEMVSQNCDVLPRQQTWHIVFCVL